MAWTQFWDMSSGGPQKLEWKHILIELPEGAAIDYFIDRFGRNPLNITCSCCGPDYDLHEADTLELVTAYERGCKWNREGTAYLLETAHQSLEELEARPDVLIIRSNEIKGV